MYTYGHACHIHGHDTPLGQCGFEYVCMCIFHTSLWEPPRKWCALAIYVCVNPSVGEPFFASCSSRMLLYCIDHDALQCKEQTHVSDFLLCLYGLDQLPLPSQQLLLSTNWSILNFHVDFCDFQVILSALSSSIRKTCQNGGVKSSPVNF